MSTLKEVNSVSGGTIHVPSGSKKTIVYLAGYLLLAIGLIGGVIFLSARLFRKAEIDGAKITQANPLKFTLIAAPNLWLAIVMPLSIGLISAVCIYVATKTNSPHGIFYAFVGIAGILLTLISAPLALFSSVTPEDKARASIREELGFSITEEQGVWELNRGEPDAKLFRVRDHIEEIGFWLYSYELTLPAEVYEELKSPSGERKIYDSEEERE